MGITVYQSIVIQNLRIGGVTNSSIVQIGTAGIIKSLANLYNTGGFTGPAPEAAPLQETQSISSLVPLAPPAAR